jgi:membrane protein
VDRDLVKQVLKGFERNDLLTFGSAIAFQVVVAIVPLLLFGFGLLGALGLEDVYSDDVVPNLKDAVSPDVFKVLDSTIRQVLGGHQTWWITIGAVLVVWEMSGAVRAIMDVLDRIYESDRSRTPRQRYTASILLATGCGLLILLAVALHQVIPAVTDSVIGVLRWPIVALLLYAAVAMLVHFAPSEQRKWESVSIGAALVVVSWLGTSAVFGLYATQIADYGSIFGNLATLFVTFEYVYLAACAFLTGAQVDQILHERSVIPA